MEESKKPILGRPQKLNRDHVLNVAMMSYWADGPTYVSINEICKRADVSKPGLYREFGSEDGLKHAALIAYRTMAYNPIYKILETEQTFDQGLEAIINFFIFYRQARGLPCGCLHVDMRHQKEKFGALTVEKIDSFQQEIQARFETWIDRAKVRDEFKVDMLTSNATLYIFAQLISAMRLQKEGTEQKIVESFLRLALSVFV